MYFYTYRLSGKWPVETEIITKLSWLKKLANSRLQENSVLFRFFPEVSLLKNITVPARRAIIGRNAVRRPPVANGAACAVIRHRPRPVEDVSCDDGRYSYSRSKFTIFCRFSPVRASSLVAAAIARSLSVMATGWKILLGVTAAAVFGLVAYGRQVASRFSFQISRYGDPDFQGSMLTIPVIIRFNNPADFAIPVQRLLVNSFLVQTDGTFKPIATVDQSLSIPPGVTEQPVRVDIDLEQLFTNVLATLQTLFTFRFNIFTRATVTAAGVTLPPQEFTNQIDLTEYVA